MFKKPLWQTVWTQIGAVCSGSRLLASILNLSVILGNYLQQMTSADDIFRCIFFLAFKGWMDDRLTDGWWWTQKDHKKLTLSTWLRWAKKWKKCSFFLVPSRFLIFIRLIFILINIITISNVLADHLWQKRNRPLWLAIVALTALLIHEFLSAKT